MLLYESDPDKISKAENVNIKVVNIGAGGAVAVRMSAASSFIKKITLPPGSASYSSPSLHITKREGRLLNGYCCSWWLVL